MVCVCTQRLRLPNPFNHDPCIPRRTYTWTMRPTYIGAQFIHSTAYKVANEHISCGTDLTSSAKGAVNGDAGKLPGLLEVSATHPHLPGHLLRPVTHYSDVETEIIFLRSLP